MALRMAGARGQAGACGVRMHLDIWSLGAGGTSTGSGLGVQLDAQGMSEAQLSSL